MTYYYGKYNDGYGFLHSDIHEIQSHHIKLTDDDYVKMLHAINSGAVAEIVDGKIILKDYKNNQIHFHQIHSDSYFGPPSPKITHADEEKLWINEQVAYAYVMDKKFTSEMKKYANKIDDMIKSRDEDVLSRPEKIFE